MMNIRPIHTEEDLTWALGEVASYFKREPRPGSADAARFEVLSALIATYENEHWAIPDADPIAVLHYALSDMGHDQADLAALLGSRSRASEVLSKRRPLTLDMIRKISAAWNLPVELLVRPYDLENTRSKAAPLKSKSKPASVKRSRKGKAA